MRNLLVVELIVFACLVGCNSEDKSPTEPPIENGTITDMTHELLGWDGTVYTGFKETVTVYNQGLSENDSEFYVNGGQYPLLMDTTISPNPEQQGDYWIYYFHNNFEFHLGDEVTVAVTSSSQLKWREDNFTIEPPQ